MTVRTWGLIGVMTCVALGGVLIALRWSKPAPQPISIGVIAWPGFYDLAVAARQGAWHYDHRPIVVTVFPDHATCIGAFRAGQIAIWTGVLSDAILMADHGVPLQIIAAIDHSTQADVMLGRPGMTLAKIKGATIAFDGVNSFSHLFVLRWLERLGIPEVDVHMVNLKAKDIPAALQVGQIDVGHTWASLAAAPAQSGYQVLGDAAAEPGVIAEVMAVRSDMIDTTSPAIRRMVADLFVQRAYWRARPSAELLIQAAGVFGCPTEQLVAIAPRVHLCDEAEHRQALRRDPPGALLIWAERWTDLLRKRGQLSSEFLPAQLLPVVPP